MRLIVLGLPASGKTTLARTLSQRTGISHIEVDTYFWKPHPVSPEDLRATLRPLLEADSWIVEGHFSKIAAEVLPLADQIVWLDPPLMVTWGRALKRVGQELFRRRLGLARRLRFLKLRDARTLNAHFATAVSEASRRGVKCTRVKSGRDSRAVLSPYR